MRHVKRLSAFFAAGLALVFVGAFYAPSAEAIPSFARRLNKTCSSCHTAFPLLNKTGREFRENGFKLSRKDEPESIISDFLKLDESFPVSAIVVARPYDEKSSGDRKLRAIHEVELMVGGSVGKDFSVFFELEAEDETGFEPEIGEARLGYHPFKWLNFILAWGPAFVSDPYDTLAGSRRLTRGRNAVIDQKFGGGDDGGRLRGTRQTAQIYGRPLDMLFYSFAYSGIAGDAEGVDAATYSGRLAVDVLPQLMLGVFGLAGVCTNDLDDCPVYQDHSRIGFDAQAEFMNVRLTGAFVSAVDERSNGAVDDENNAWYLEGSYAYQRKGRPFIVPLVRFDQYEKASGKEDYSEIVLNLSVYPWENVRVFLEYWDQLDVPAGMEKDNRITLQIVAGL